MSYVKCRNVLLVGASGNAGKNILPALLADTNFKVSVLSRANSSATFPANVNIIHVNYSDKPALVKALTDQDVVISAVGGDALLNNLDKSIIEACLQAGVKWFIPAEYGFDFNHDSASSIPINNGRLENIKILKENQSNLAHTFVSTGAFLDWGLDTGFLGFDIANRMVTLYDQGKHLVSGMILKNLGKTIVAILHQPQLTLNKRIYIADATFTQQDILALFEKYTNVKWAVKHATTEETLKNAEEAWANGNILNGYIGFILGLAYSGKGACDFEDKINNQDLGLERVSLEQAIKEAVQRNEINVH
ncbi:unnamed protein product [Rotaria magnacalcarata]|uniref:NmrA-like domain-containing protein n=1 Tax=Rotaria magnacalcarata TaxID=392030 RepID=A0A816Z9S7_9BILA|nr:unnamed protein product [Rotaria magnacalcarata]CAF1613698.1 unnamed protein product [Rotaria magnacalcarata]CAF2162455.1 unnamed protein product [Rotaria magnacalcarata]CAF2199147.1 unnamed protein product [Rotaria magnacalcarata]CAF2271387.1 unnamed protein product [Rotaria magnacalcarata]